MLYSVKLLLKDFQFWVASSSVGLSMFCKAIFLAVMFGSGCVLFWNKFRLFKVDNAKGNWLIFRGKKQQLRFTLETLEVSFFEESNLDPEAMLEDNDVPLSMIWTVKHLADKRLDDCTAAEEEPTTCSEKPFSEAPETLVLAAEVPGTFILAEEVPAGFNLAEEVPVRLHWAFDGSGAPRKFEDRSRLGTEAAASLSSVDVGHEVVLLAVT